MLRGFRWQLLALVLAAALFALSLIVKNAEEASAPQPTAEVAPTVAADSAEPASSDVVVVPTDLPTDAAAPDGEPPAEGGEVVTFSEALIGHVQRLNPILASLNPVDADITGLIFEGLTRINAYGEPEPALAERWVISADGLEYTVFLRQDVLWQDGVPFTSADVDYTMSLLRSPDFPGAEDLNTFWRTVETQVLGQHLVRFRLTQPLGTFLDKLKIGILPEHALRGTGAAQIADHPFNLTPIGTGPYQLEALRAADGMTVDVVDLRVAPVYRQRAEAQNHAFAVERVRFRLYSDFESALEALISGEVDGLAGIDRSQRRTLFEVANNNDLPMYNTIEPSLGVLIFNWAQSDSRFFREQRVRVALEIGLDRASAIERTLSNRAVLALSPIMPNTWAYLADLPWPGYNPEQARALLTTAVERLEQLAERAGESEAAEAEATAEPGIPALASFSILTPDEPALVSLTQEIAAQWTQLGLSVTVIAATPERYWQQLDSGSFDVALIELSQGESADPDIYSFWHQGQYPDGENYGGVDDRRISELLERARRDPYGINRISDYHEFQRVFVDRAIAIPLYYPLYTYVTSRRVDGIQLGFVGLSSDRFRNIGDWRVQ